MTVRAEIRALAAYSMTAETHPVKAKLDFNESPYDVPEAVKARVLERLGERRWSVYPEFGSPRLKAAIARSLGRSADEIVVGNGSGEVILAAVSVLAGCGGALLLAPPTFSLYRQMAAIAGARVVEVPRVGSDFAIEADAFVAKAGEAVPLLASPNNPTGGVTPVALVERLCERAEAVLLDQAYLEFAEPSDDALPLLERHLNLVVFRTLSKAFSAAGFRIGYAVASPELAREIEKAVLPFSVDAAAEDLAVTLLDDPAECRARIAGIVAERERVAAALTTLGIAVAPSRANFLHFVPPDGDAAGVRRRLLERGVLIRDLARSLRVSIGTPAENDLFLDALKESL